MTDPAPVIDNNTVRNVAHDVARSARRARWIGLGLIAVGAMAMLVAAAGTIFMGSQVRTLVRGAVAEQAEQQAEAEREARLVNDIMACILGQFAEHRAASREFFNQAADAHRFPRPAAAQNPTGHDPAKVQEACDRTLRKLDQEGR